MLRSAVRALLPHLLPLAEGRWRHTQSRRPCRAFLGVEALEDRAVPAVITVNSLADLANPAAGTVTLRSAINLANTNGAASNTIDLAVPGTYQLTQGQLSITATTNLTIQNTSGGTASVDGGGISRVFDINAAGENTTPFTVTFQGLTIEDGVASPGDGPDGSGGGIRAQEAANVVLTNVVLENNTATADGGGISMESPNNDAIGTLTITGCTIANNHAGDAGGGVESDGTGTISINSSNITDNTCVNQGAGVWLDAGTANLFMTGDVVNGNQALFMLGGGIGNAGSGNVTLTGCTIENNSCGSSLQTVNNTPTLVPGTGGGFADAANLGSLTVTNCVFLDNTAAGDGGGIQEGGPNTTITNTVFQGNLSGGMGGGVFLNGTTATLTNDVLQHNTALDGGGAEADAATFTATNCTFQANDAQGTNAGTDGFGGAIEIINEGTGTLTDQVANCLFLDNAANNGQTTQGGAILQTAGTLTVTASQFTGNVSGVGGAIEAEGAGLTVLGSTFNQNQADGGNGGAIDAQSSATIKLSTFVGNVASNDGGAISGSVGTLTLTADTINDNTASVLGGGLEEFTTGIALLGDSILFGNSPQDAFGRLTNEGGNLVGNSGGDLEGAVISSNPKLGALLNNGGPFVGAFNDGETLLTEALLPGSPAIGVGFNGMSGMSVDARGFPSPAAGRTNVAIGAFEPQYAANATTSQVFVEDVTEYLLNEPGSKATTVNAASLVSMLTHNTSATSLVEQLENTTAYKTSEITTLFERYLDRAPSTAELNTYMSLLLKGETLEQLGAALSATPEFFNVNGGTNATFVQGLFERALNRQPTAAELASYEQALANHVSRTTVAMDVLCSTEYRTNLVNADFESALGRAPNGNELAFYVGQLNHGARDQLVLAEVLGLTEAFTDRS